MSEKEPDPQSHMADLAAGSRRWLVQAEILLRDIEGYLIAETNWRKDGKPRELIEGINRLLCGQDAGLSAK